jgi:hypothetical protein
LHGALNSDLTGELSGSNFSGIRSTFSDVGSSISSGSASPFDLNFFSGISSDKASGAEDLLATLSASQLRKS